MDERKCRRKFICESLCPRSGIYGFENIREWDYEKTNPFDVINQMVLSATGEDMHPYDYFGLPEPTAEGCELTTDSWADWSYTSGRQQRRNGYLYVHTGDFHGFIYLF